MLTNGRAGRGNAGFCMASRHCTARAPAAKTFGEEENYATNSCRVGDRTAAPGEPSCLRGSSTFGTPFAVRASPYPRIDDDDLTTPYQVQSVAAEPRSLVHCSHLALRIRSATKYNQDTLT